MADRSVTDVGYVPVAVDVAALRRERLARLRDVLRDADVAAALFFDPINIRYATDVTNMQIWCLHNPARYAFVAAEGPVIQFEFASCAHLAAGIETIDEIRPAIASSYMMAGPDADDRAVDWAAEVADLVTRHGGGNRTAAVDRLNPAGFLALAKLDVTAVDGQRLAEQARACKTPQELNAIRDSIAACEVAVGAMGAALRPGVSERALWSVLHQQNIALGGEWIETRLLTSGPRTNPWYQECGNRIIENGDLVAFDTDMVGRHGYCSDISRTWRAGDGRARDDQRRTYVAAYAHLERLKDIVKPGLTLGDLARRIGPPPTDARGYTCLLHGIGMCDEYPTSYWAGQMGQYDGLILPGMTLCLESYYGPADAAEGVKLEEQVLVTDIGIEVLSSLPFETAWL